MTSLRISSSKFTEVSVTVYRDGHSQVNLICVEFREKGCKIISESGREIIGRAPAPALAGTQPRRHTRTRRRRPAGPVTVAASHGHDSGLLVRVTVTESLRSTSIYHAWFRSTFEIFSLPQITPQVEPPGSPRVTAPGRCGPRAGPGHHRRPGRRLVTQASSP